jgi:uncharacterized protein YdhG (YjbR/CyaY superfamily)
MSAVFSASGKTFDTDGFLASSALSKYAEIWRAGVDKHKTNGFQIVIRDDPELKKQIEGVVGFIRKCLPELKRLRASSGLESVDFRIAYFWHEDVAALTYELPPELHVALAQIPASLTFCVYPCSKEEANQPAEPVSPSRAGSP